MAVSINDSLEEKLDALSPHNREVESRWIQIHWLKLDTWTISEAALLLLGIDPAYIELYVDDREIGNLYANTLLVASNCEGISLSIQRIEIDIETSNQNYSWWDNKVIPREFTQWAKAKGFYVSKLLDDFLVQGVNQLKVTRGGSDNPSNHPVKRKTTLRIEEICNAVKERFDDPMNIPYGGKIKLKQHLCDLKPELFTSSTFDAAWKKAKKEKLIEVENVEEYKHSK